MKFHTPHYSASFRQSAPYVARGVALSISLVITIGQIVWAATPSLRERFAIAHMVGAYLRVCPGLGLRATTGADTQFCPYTDLQTALISAQLNTITNPAVQIEIDARPLELCKPIERELAGGQAHLYQITLTAGHFLRVVTEQRGIDVVVTLFGHDGEKLIEVDSPNGTQGPEPLAVVIETSGNYRLEVRALEKGAAAGRYDVNVAELREATAKDRALAEAVKLYNEAENLREKGMYDEAIPLAERVVRIREKELGTEDLDVGMAHFTCAILYQAKGDFTKAELHYQRVLSIRKNKLGPDHLDVAAAQNSLGFLCRLKGDYGKAEFFYLRALALREKRLRSEHPEIAQSLNNLAVLYLYKGDYIKALNYAERALAMWERTSGPVSANVAIALDNLGLLHRSVRDFANAEMCNLRALSIWEKVAGPEHPDFATSLDNLAALYLNQGDYSTAEPLNRRALQIREKKLGLEHPYVAHSLNTLATIDFSKGAYIQGESHARRALAIFEKMLGPTHPSVASSLNTLARLLLARGELQQAIACLIRSNSVSERNISHNLLTGSERQKLAYLALFSEQTNHSLSLHAQSAPNDPGALNLALTTLLRRKGRALDAMTDMIAPLRRHASAQDQALLDQLSSVRTQLAAVTLRGPGTANSDSYRLQLMRLTDEMEKLEARISAHSAEFQLQTQPVTIEAVQSTIPDGAALVEFALYAPYDAKTRTKGSLRYIAYALVSRGEPRWTDLGPATPIDRAVAALRRALRDPKRADVNRLARALDEKVMRPVRSLLGEKRRVLVSPDGSLNLIPFAVLVDERNRYLAESHEFSYLTSGRDLLRLGLRAPSKQGPVVVADPAFGQVSSSETTETRDVGLPPGPQKPLTQGVSLAQMRFSRLQGTAGEARALRAILPQVTLLTQDQATESALKQVKGPNILHVATHGFFLKDLEIGPSGARDLGLPAGGQATVAEMISSFGNTQLENPLLRSGLALAGANEHKGGDEDGVLTALEAADLDLCGTKLAVLSACDTGVGEVKNGEGVYGLRRALVLAGSESQVMSLWPVSDLGTRDLMISYYKSLQQGLGRSEALRRAQLRMLRSKRLSHPFYWAGFIQSGEWGNLQGKRPIKW